MCVFVCIHTKFLPSSNYETADIHNVYPFNFWCGSHITTFENYILPLCTHSNPLSFVIPFDLTHSLALFKMMRIKICNNNLFEYKMKYFFRFFGITFRVKQVENHSQWMNVYQNESQRREDIKKRGAKKIEGIRSMVHENPFRCYEIFLVDVNEFHACACAYVIYVFLFVKCELK